MNTDKRLRIRQLGLKIGRYKTGRYNAITAVKGVRVGHSTIVHGDFGSHNPKQIARTGVTAIIPNEDTFMHSVVSGGFVLNGAGEVSGLTQVTEWGVIETPILLTNTLSVGTSADALVQWYIKKHPEIGAKHDVVIPIVGECDDSWLNGITGQHIKDHHVFEALDTASDGPVQEGNVGGGTGMITCDFKGGLGTSSRKLDKDLGGFTIGVLVQSNFGRLSDLRMGGIPIGPILAPDYEQLSKRTSTYGSIIAVIATDAPLLPSQLDRLSKRSALGIGRAGSIAAHGSGEIVIAFSNSNTVKRESRKMYHRMYMLRDSHMDPLYEAVIDATEEAILNAMCMAEEMTGINQNFAPALPLDKVRRIIETYRLK